MTIKEFYLRIKIANIRKRLAENESLNKEICLDPKAHKDLINVKLMIKLLEEVAEGEQKLIQEEEKEAALKKANEEEEKKRDTINGSDVETPRSTGEMKTDEDLNEEAKKEKTKEKSAIASDKGRNEDISDSYGVDVLKFKNAQIQGKSGKDRHASPQ